MKFIVFFPEQLFCHFSFPSFEPLLDTTLLPGPVGANLSGRWMCEPSPERGLQMQSAGEVTRGTVLTRQVERCS